MKIIVAPQAFKGTASAATVADSMCRGILLAIPHAEVVPIPIADGGSGTVEALVSATGGSKVSTPTNDPLDRPIAASWGVLGDGKTAVIETAAASGLALLSVSERDPTITTTKGTGNLIRAALDAGFRHLLIGLGDSATNDAGVGMAQALGIRALDDESSDLPVGGAALSSLHSFNMDHVHVSLASSEITALYDVNNPLYGLDGASAIYGPQKGATYQQISILDAALTHFANVVEAQLKCNVRDIPGSGAAGGLGAGLIAFCGAILKPGFEVISNTLGLRERLIGADLVLTGEGRIDAQTIAGKGVTRVASLAKECGVPLVAAIVGSNGLDLTTAPPPDIDGVFELSHSRWDINANTEATPYLIEIATARAVISLFKGKEI